MFESIEMSVASHAYPVNIYIYMVVDLKVLDSIVYDDDPEHIKISFGESFILELAKVIVFLAKDLAKD